MMKFLQLIFILFFTISCSTSKLFGSAKRYEKKRLPIDNSAFLHKHQEHTSNVTREVEERINDYKYKDDFSIPVSSVDLDTVPNKVIIHNIDIEGEDLYTLPESKVKKPSKKEHSQKHKKTHVKKHHNTKHKTKVKKAPQKPKLDSKKTHNDHKSQASKYPNLADTPKPKATPEENKKYAEEKKEQATKMDNNAKQVKTPSVKSHEHNNGHYAKPVVSEEDIHKKLDQLQKRHNTIMQNAEQSSNKEAKQKSNSKIQAPEIPTVAEGTKESSPTTHTNNSQQPANSAPANADKNDSTSSDSKVPKTPEEQGMAENASGIPPAPSIPSGFGQQTTEPSQSKNLKSLSPVKSKVGKKKITIKKDLSLEQNNATSTNKPN